MQGQTTPASDRSRFAARALARAGAGIAAQPGWAIVIAVLVSVLALPAITVVATALTSPATGWPHLARTVLPGALRDTGLLLLGAGILTLAIGAATAWLVTMYRFPGRSVLDRLLVLPMAMPTYIVAYCYVELLDYAGPVQSALRAMLGWSSPRDYWFPDIRSLPGAVLVLSAVLYPYVYLTARASFVQQSVCVLEVARTLGRTPIGVLTSVALPLARPALATGVALVLMECLNDLGAVQYLGVPTLSAVIYATWLQRSDLGGAMQVAAVLLVVVLMLLLAERGLRGGGKFHHTTGRYRSIPFQQLAGWQAGVAFGVCLLPVVLGFAIPVLVLLRHATTHGGEAIAAGFWSAARNSVTTAALAALAAVAIGLVIAYGRRLTRSPLAGAAGQVAGLGYALPGTVLAIGLILPLAAFDNRLDALVRSVTGIGTGLLLSGSIAAVTLAYTIRFLAVALGAIDDGLGRISPNLDAAARTLGASPLATLFTVHLPLLMPAMGSAALLVFVDAMKELPATLLLRPFNFHTLATRVYDLAALEQLEAASVSALAIVLVGLVPVMLLHKAVAGGRSGS